MVTIEINERTTERDIERGTRFLKTLSFSLPIFRLLAVRAGYNNGEHDRGWDLVTTVMGRKAAHERETTEATQSIPKARVAVTTLDSYDGTAFARTEAALEARFPAQLEFLLGGLVQGKGAESVGVVGIFLDRYRTLKDGTEPEREATREQDRQAVALLEQRRIIDPEIEAELRECIAQAKEAPVDTLVEEVDPRATPEYRQAAHDLHVWLKDWRAQARAVISRRDYLIRLGLASRRHNDDDDDEIAELDQPSVVGA